MSGKEIAVIFCVDNCWKLAMRYEFTNDWFAHHRPLWKQLLPKIKPSRIVEIGCFEGQCTSFLIETASKDNCLEMFCIDTFEGGVEHQKGGVAETDMTAVETRFLNNIEIAKSKAENDVSITVLKGRSDRKLASLLAVEDLQPFDFIYVDGSHIAALLLTYFYNNF